MTIEDGYPRWLPKRRREIYHAHRAKFPKPKIRVAPSTRVQFFATDFTTAMNSAETHSLQDVQLITSISLFHLAEYFGGFY
jgi:hypothetical protein